MYATDLQWGTVPEWFTALAFFLALYSILREHNKDRYSAHLARVGRARRVSIKYGLQGTMELVDGVRCIRKPELAYSITNNTEFPIFSICICPWNGDMPQGVAAKSPEIAYRLDSGKSVTGIIPWLEDLVKEENVQFCGPEVLFEDVDLYRWRFDPDDGLVSEKPFDTPDTRFMKRWRYWRWRYKEFRFKLSQQSGE